MGDRVARRRAVGHLGNVLIEGHQDRAFELLSEAMAEPGLTPDDDGYVEIAEALAKLFMRRSRFAEAVALIERALPAAESRGLTVLAVEMLTTRAVALSNINRPIESIASLMGVIGLADRHNLQDPLLRATINLGYALEPDDPEAAYRVSREGAARARQMGQRFGLRYLVGNSTSTAIQIGDWEWALTEVRDPIWDDLEPAERIWLGAVEAEILAARGEPVAELIAELEGLVVGFDDPQYRGNVAYAGWMAMMAAGHYAEVIEPGRGIIRLGRPGSNRRRATAGVSRCAPHA